MKNINRMINKTIIEITFLMVLCIISFFVFNTRKIQAADKVVYTDIEVLKNYSRINIENFSRDSQIKLLVSNSSNTSEKYNVLLTSNYDLTKIEDYLKIKINDNEYLLKDLKVSGNYFLVDEGSMKANSKEINIYFAIDDNHKQIFNGSIPFYFINDLTI